jgi:uncharacterized phage protein (TIGR01671 family)
MREILFRAYDTGRKEYLSGGNLFIAINNSQYPNKSEIYLDVISNADKYKERFVIEQYTGLTDKNGKKIFEGDIVALHDYIIGEIVFECGTFGIGACKTFDYNRLESEIESITGCDNSPNFCYNDNFISLWELYWNYNQDNNILEVVEVIGNVTDNPELMEVG